MGVQELLPRFMFHYINENDVTYLCLADNNYKMDLAYKFLEDIQGRFLKKYG